MVGSHDNAVMITIVEGCLDALGTRRTIDADFGGELFEQCSVNVVGAGLVGGVVEMTTIVGHVLVVRTIGQQQADIDGMIDASGNAFGGNAKEDGCLFARLERLFHLDGTCLQTIGKVVVEAQAADSLRGDVLDRGFEAEAIVAYNLAVQKLHIEHTEIILRQAFAYDDAFDAERTELACAPIFPLAVASDPGSLGIGLTDKTQALDTTCLLITEAEIKVLCAVDGNRGGECHFVPSRLERLHSHFGDDFARQTAAHPCRHTRHVGIDRAESDAERGEFGTGIL